VDEKDDSSAAYMLGEMYKKGEGCPADEKESEKWFIKSSHLYHLESKHESSQGIDKKKNVLYNCLESTGDKESDETVYKYLHALVNLKAYKTNYLLPMSVRVNGDYDENTQKDTSKTEIEFQVSVRYDFVPNFLGLGEIYTVAYTQHSFWQYYVGDAYFRTTDYNPAMFITVPISTKYMKAIKFSVEHTSNGVGLPDERAWNYITLSSYFQYKSLFTELQVWHRMDDNYDYNPELIDTMGHGHVKFILPYKKHFMTLLLRSNFNGKEAIDASYSYPLFGESLFLYIKAFSGYGESMISYAGNPENGPSQDEYVQKIGIGFGLSR